MPDPASMCRRFRAYAARRIGTAQPFVVEGRRTYRTIGYLIVVVSLFAFLAGVGFSAAADMGIERYKKPSGKFMRFLSDKDESYFKGLQTVNMCGTVLKIIGLVILLPGVLGILRPDRLHGAFVRLKLDRRM